MSEYTSAGLAQQAAEVELDRFDRASAIALGRLATERAVLEGLGIVLEVRHLGQLAFRAALPGSHPDNDDWISRKRRIVERFEVSSMALRVRFEENNTTFAEFAGRFGISASEYTAFGGGFPITVTDVGIVGGMYVSGLTSQEADHEFIVECLRDLKAR